MNAIIDNTTQTVLATEPTATVNGISDLLHDIGKLAVDVSTAESFYSSGKEKLSDMLSHLRDTGAVLDGDTRTNDVRRALRDAIAETGLSEQRVKDIVSMLTMYYNAGCMVTTLSNNKAAKESIDKQLAIRANSGTIEGENVVPSTTKKVVRPKKSDAEKAKEKAEKLTKEFETKLMDDSIEHTLCKLVEHNEFHHLVHFIVVTEDFDPKEFMDYMGDIRNERAKKRAEYEAKLAELEAMYK